jgi:hypothetical protein
MAGTLGLHLLGQIHLEQPGVPSVRPKDGIGKVTEQRDKSESKVEGNVEHHPGS